MTPQRKCGDCQLCCRLLPIQEPLPMPGCVGLDKGANVTCKHQCAKGCSVYERRPMSCRLWNCAWLANPSETDGMARPDVSHYVVDTMLSSIRMTDTDIGLDETFVALQVWVDPLYPTAHQDPALRNLLAKKAEEGLPAIIRYSESEGFVLFGPAFSKDGEWREQRSSASAPMPSPGRVFA